MIHSEYFSKVFTPKAFKKSIAFAKRQLKDVDFEAIAVCGCSGMLYGSALAFAMNKKLILVRKQCDVRSMNSNAFNVVSGDSDFTKFIFVDDFIATGKTRDYVISMVKSWVLTDINLVGAFIYESGWEFSAGYHPDALFSKYPAKE